MGAFGALRNPQRIENVTTEKSVCISSPAVANDELGGLAEVDGAVAGGQADLRAAGAVLSVELAGLVFVDGFQPRVREMTSDFAGGG